LQIIILIGQEIIRYFPHYHGTLHFTLGQESRSCVMRFVIRCLVKITYFWSSIVHTYICTMYIYPIESYLLVGSKTIFQAF